MEKYLKPFLIGKPADRIEDIWQACYNSSYWRNGPVLNNAISGVDQALWDIKGRQAGMPVYQLVGGKCREAADCLRARRGRRDPAGASIRRAITWTRASATCACRWACPAWPATARRAAGASDRGPARRAGLRSGGAMARLVKLLEEVRKQLGDEVELLHDMHERVSPNQAVQFSKDVEPFQLFFIEDPLSPEDIAYFRQIRQQCATPIAMGELFNSPHEWTPLITERLIDYIRIHVTQAGGFTPARKIAAMAEIFGVKTAWHGPGDVSPIGHMANVTLDVVCYNFGIQEYSPFNERTAGSLPRLPGDEERVPVCQRVARMGHRDRRSGGGQSAVYAGPQQFERRMGRAAAAGRSDHQAVIEMRQAYLDAEPRRRGGCLSCLVFSATPRLRVKFP